MKAFSEGFLLGGRVSYRQYADGHRTGIEPVLLAAAIPARAGETVLEAGTGAGAGLLCLLARVPNARGTGVELDPQLAALARHNVDANSRSAVIEAGDVACTACRADHCFANPPWFPPDTTLSPDPGRTLARHRTASGLRPWVEGLVRVVSGRGTITLALPAALVGPAFNLLDEVGWGRVSVMPLWPRAGREAKVTLVQARRGRSGTRLLPGLVLHEERGFTEEAEAVLRDGNSLWLGS